VHITVCECGSEAVTSLILKLSIRYRRVVSFTPRPPYSLVKGLLYPSKKRAGGPQDNSGRFGEDKYTLTLESTPTGRLVYIDIIPALLCYGSSIKITFTATGQEGKEVVMVTLILS